MNIYLDMALRLLLAAVAGSLIGFQRGRVHKPAGLRTHALISTGAALFTIVSIYGFGFTADSARVAAGVVAGVGFIGAGAILHRQTGTVEGLTTAATIWAVAAIGLAAGAGLYLISGIAVAIVLIVLVLPHLFRSG